MSSDVTEKPKKRPKAHIIDTAHEMTMKLLEMDISRSRSNAGNQSNPKRKPIRKRSSDPPVGSPLLPQPNNVDMVSSLDDGDDDSMITIHRKGNVPQPSDYNFYIKHDLSSRTVTFAPLPPGNATTATSSALQHEGKGRVRTDYSLGENARYPSHMIERAASSDKAFRSVNELKALDFAFVKRSSLDERYSYAILACRSLEPHVDASNPPPGMLEECMIFVLSDAGSTMKLRKNQWVECVRLVSLAGLDSTCEGSNSSIIKYPKRVKPTKKISLNEGDWVPPNIIAFPPTTTTTTTNDDCTSDISAPSFHPESNVMCSF